VGPMGIQRENPVAALLPDGRVLVAGGSNAGGTENSAEIFNPSTNGFTPIGGTLNTRRDSAVAAPLRGGNVLVAGGHNASSAWLASAEIFDATTGTFSPTGSMGTLRSR